MIESGRNKTLEYWLLQYKSENEFLHVMKQKGGEEGEVRRAEVVITETQS